MNDSRIRWSTAFFDALLILLLLLPASLGSVFYGGVEFWVSGPLMVTIFAVATVLCLRFTLHRDGTGLCLPPALIGLFLLAMYACWRIPHSAVPGEGREEVLKILSFAVAYAAFCNLSARHGRWRMLLAVCLLVVNLICWYALIQHAQGTNLVLVEPRPEQYGMRASGTFFCPNHLAYVLSLIVVVSVGIVIHRQAGWPLRVWAAYVGLFSVPVLFLTESRSGWIGTTVGISVLVLLLAARRGAKRLLISAAALAVGLVLVGGGLWSFSSTFQKRVKPALRGNARIVMWKDTVQAIADEPVWGHGPNTYRWIYPHYKEAFVDRQVFPKHAHNEYLNFTVEYGGVGAALLGATLLVGLVQLLRLHRRVASRADALLMAILLGILATTAAHAFFDFNLHIFSAVHLLFAIAAVLLGEMYAGGELRSYRLSRRWRIPMGLAGTVTFALLSWYTVRVTAAHLLTLQATHLRTEEFAVDAAQELVERAIQLDAHSYQTFDELGRILATRSTFFYDRARRPAIAREAVEAYERMLKLNPLNHQGHVELSQLYADQLDDPAKALSLLQEAIEYAPKSSIYYSQMGHLLRELGYPEQALAIYQAARTHNPSDETIRLNIRNLKAELGKK